MIEQGECFRYLKNTYSKCHSPTTTVTTKHEKKLTIGLSQTNLTMSQTQDNPNKENSSHLSIHSRHHWTDLKGGLQKLQHQ